MATSSTNLLVNGSFESSTVGVNRWAGFQSVPGWTALPGGTIELWNAHKGVTATQGVNFVELDYGSGYDGFYQTVQTASGQTYTLAFDARTRPGTTSATTTIEVLWNDKLVATMPPGASWATSTYTVIGTGGQDRLTFREVQGQSSDGLGAMLDNVRLMAADSGTSNQPPVARDDDTTTTEDTAVTLALLANDTDPDIGAKLTVTEIAGRPITVGSSVDVGHAVVTLNDDGTLRVAPDPNFNGSLSFDYRVSDGALSDESAVTVVVTPVADAPVLAVALADQTVKKDEAFAFMVPANAFKDPDGDTLSYTAGLAGGNPLPSWITFTAATRTFTGTPGQADVGSLSVQVVASDGTQTASDTYVLTVTPGQVAGTNLLVNGSFESSTVGVNRWAGFQSVPGWTALPGGTIELWNAHRGVTATQGVNFVELDFGSGYDGFYQTVQTASGQTYTLAFDARTRPGTTSATTTIEVLWNDKLVATMPPGASWATSTYTVIGTGGQDRLTFREVQGQSSDGLGAMLDNVRLMAADSGTPTTLLSFANQADRAKVVDLGKGFWADAARVLPLGDSNTHGWSSLPQDQWEGYRLDLWNLAAQDNLWFDYVGSSVNGPKALPDRNHQGVSGIKSTDVVGLSTDIAKTHRPDVVLLMLGTNDALRESNAANTVPGELLKIMQNITAAQPGVTILLAPLPPIDPARTSFLPNADTIRTEINAQLPNVVAQAKASGIAAAFVQMSDLTTGDLTDGVHLTDGGHAKIAAAWYSALLANVATDNGTFGSQRTSISGIVDVQGSELGDRLRGNAAANAIDSRGGADQIEGAGGADQLTGGAGADTFVYKAASEGGDTVTDFVSILANALTSDTLTISASGFGGGLAAGGIVDLVQSSGPVATGSKAQFLFDKDDGRLFWDGDGVGASTPMLVAKLIGVTSLSANDFLIIA